MWSIITSRRKKPLLNNRGFTLLETMIALTIMVLAFSSILMVESGSINTSTKAKQMNIVAMLAHNAMVDTEYKLEGKTFNEMKKEESDHFPEPFQTYTWKRTIKELKFPRLNLSAAQKKTGDTGGEDQGVDLLTKLITKFMTQAIREVTITVSWKKGEGEQNFSVSTYWVDLNHEFSHTE